jgi:tetratricopeptide (TPR) repeat protein
VRAPFLVVLLLLAPGLLAAQGPDKVIDVRSARPPAGNSFEAVWSAYRKADERGDTEAQQHALREIRRLRIERNIRSLEPIALARVAQGLERLQAGERDRAEECFYSALGLDPYLPDAHFALATIELKKGPLEIGGALRHTLAGMTSHLPTIRGRHQVLSLLIPVALVSLLVTAFVLALALLFRHGGLLLHDLEETMGAARGAALPLAATTLLLLLPAVTFQGWAWVPFWMLALLFIYLEGREKLVVCVLLVCGLAIGPLVKVLETRNLAQRNPLFGAGIESLEGGPDARAMAVLEEAARQTADDRDLLYLLAAQYRKAGRYEDAAGLYRDVLRQEPNDSFALNNLGNLEFAGGEFQAAIARYKQGIEAAPTARVGATFYYNLSLAHLQRFEYQPAQEARSQADRLASGLVRTYDSTWKYDKGDYAVVDLAATDDELWAKFLGTPQGVRVKNISGRGAPAAPREALVDGMRNRFTAFLGVFLVVVFVLSRWRGPRMFTRRCIKCGSPFCKRCQLGSAAGGLCTQCHHLFVVKDGVSGPARNQKLLEVQQEEGRRDRLFRILSLVAPGAGQIYTESTLVGATLVAVWAGVLSLVVLGFGLLPLTDASSALSRPWGLGLAALLLVVVYVVANRVRPHVALAMPAGSRPPRRGYAA